jgi:hypothetical protein
MKKIEHVLLIVCALLLIHLTLKFGWPPVADALVEADLLSNRVAHQITSLLMSLLKLMIPIAIAIWMYGEAKRDGGAPWVWVLLALVYQFVAPLLYYALKVHRAMNDDRKTERAAL